MHTELPTPCKARAFTLLELLIAIAIIAVLAGIILAVSQSAIRSGDRAQGLNCMKQMGLAMQASTNDHNGTLPGPFWSGQAPWYASTDQASLGAQLWSYMGAPQIQSYYQEFRAVETTAYLRARSGLGTYAYLLNSGFNEGSTHYGNPFGYPGSYSPMKESVLSSLGLVNQPAVQDMDQTNGPKSAQWYAGLPAKPIYGNKRLTLYFDWHASFDTISTN